MASTFALSRPSEKLGTHSTSVDIREGYLSLAQAATSVPSASSVGVIRSNQRGAQRQETRICASRVRTLPARTGRWGSEGARACPRQVTGSPGVRRKLRRAYWRPALNLENQLSETPPQTRVRQRKPG